ncbi:MAG: methyltransferase [Candidatus Woesearchaeota archaeon]
MEHFVKEPTRRVYMDKGHVIALDLEPGVFCPSDQGSHLSEYIDIKPGEHVLDMGTGTGFLGIVAAMEGGVVDVSDPSPRAVNLAVRNARLNGVSVRGFVGEYFCTDKDKYDYIIANLPHEVLPKSYAKEIGELERTIHGGPQGNKHILEFLQLAGEHMHENSRALVCAYGLSDYITTMHEMRQSYNPKLLDVVVGPVKTFVQDNIQTYHQGIETGDVGLFLKDGVWQSALFVYELRKKRDV